MADKLVKEITSMDEDFTQWYTDVVKKAELIEYSKVKGCMILRPNGYAIWENIQRELDARSGRRRKSISPGWRTKTACRCSTRGLTPAGPGRTELCSRMW